MCKFKVGDVVKSVLLKTREEYNAEVKKHILDMCKQPCISGIELPSIDGKKLCKTFITKQKQYSLSDDYLQNFRTAMEISGKDFASVLKGFQLKHEASIADMTRSGKKFPFEVWEEKVGDWIVYEAILKTARELTWE